jgi:hypothetical protein
MKTILWLYIVLLAGGLYGSDFRGFDHFKAPEVVGAYYSEWNPLGVTDRGFDFGVGFYLNADNESSPINFWVGKKTKVLLEINSIAAVNNVVDDAFGSQASSGHQDNSRQAIEAARRLLSTQVASGGQSGLSLFFDSRRDLVSVVSRLKNAGLDQSTASLLLRLGEECTATETIATKEWSVVWYEIDRLGGIERVTVRGSLEPVKVVSVLHEAIFDAGKVNPALLRRSNFFDLSLSR